jgi:hypothetical protein
MKTSFTIFFRHDLIDFGRLIGSVIRDADRPRPWIICITGDGDSGKSLIALAIDYCFDPRRYEDAKLSNISADRMLNTGKVENLKVGFKNVINVIHQTSEAFDASVESILSDVLKGQCHGIRMSGILPQAGMRALVISNLGLLGQLPEDDSLQSSLVDIQINVRIGKGIFTRFIEVTYNDPQLKTALEPFAVRHFPQLFKQSMMLSPG